VLALVANQPILAGDLLPQINRFVRANGDNIPASQLEAQKPQWMKLMLKQAIDTKLAYVDFLRTIPPERLEFVQEKIKEQFDEVELPKAMEKAGVHTPAELDAELRKLGSSLEKQRRGFAEQVLAKEMIRQHVKKDEEVTHEEMLAYYRAHQDEFSVPARARWEHLEVRFDKFPSKEDAYRELAQMGNEVLRGAPFAAVAQRRSQGIDAEKGGVNDWTNKESLRSNALDEAVFSLPLNSMSRIIEDEDAFHIVRVIERQPAGMMPFVEAQVKIKEQIRKQRLQDQMTAYLDRLREQTPVWTAFDDEPTDLFARPPGAQSRSRPY
jgi:parvulin-like peptidyl-prolyl isomerase